MDLGWARLRWKENSRFFANQEQEYVVVVANEELVVVANEELVVVANEELVVVAQLVLLVLVASLFNTWLEQECELGCSATTASR